MEKLQKKKKWLQTKSSRSVYKTNTKKKLVYGRSKNQIFKRFFEKLHKNKWGKIHNYADLHIIITM